MIELHCARRRAFTLLEQLMVMGIIVVLIGLAVPAISGISNSMKVTEAGHVVHETIQLGRATALARNLPVEVCILREQNSTNETSSTYQLLKTRLLKADGSWEWISGNRRFAQGVIVSEELSNIISMQTRVTIPGPTQDSEGIVLRIYPSGRVELPSRSADLPLDASLFFTVGLERDFERSPAIPPANFATILIDSRNARVITYRP